MKCVYCQEKAGFFKRICADCVTLMQTVRSLPVPYGYSQLLDALLATNIGNSKIEKFLDAEIAGQPSVNDQITARMTNEVMAGLGQPSHMTGTDVKKVRKDIAEGRAPSLSDGEVTDYNQLPHKN